MKKKLFLFTLFLIAGVLILWGGSRSNKSAEVQIIKKKKKIIKISSVKSFATKPNRQTQEKIKYKINCDESAKSFELDKTLSDHQLKELLKCNKKSAHLLKKLKDACDKDNQIKKCEQVKFEITLGFVHENSKDKDVADLTNRELIAALITPFSKSSNLDSMNFDELKAIANRIIDIDDTIYAAYKVKLMSDILPFFTGKKDNPGEFFETLDLMEKFDIEGHDPQLYDVRALAIFKSNRPEKLLEYGEKMLESKPNSGIGSYFQAMYFFKKNNKEKTKALLEKASDLEPNNKKYSEALRELKLGKKKIFSLSLSFNIEEF